VGDAPRFGSEDGQVFDGRVIVMERCEWSDTPFVEVDTDCCSLYFMCVGRLFQERRGELAQRYCCCSDYTLVTAVAKPGDHHCGHSLS
jgi:hypothetical protein